MFAPDTIASLRHVADLKAAELAARPDVVAVAITGSLPRGMTWAGSDVDLWAFTEGEPEDDFIDGVIDGIYWEADFKPVSWLTETPESAWLTPPPLHGHDGVTPVEALWRCKVVSDHDGTLTQVARAVAGCMADRVWLTRRAYNFLYYGLGALDALGASETSSDEHLLRTQDSRLITSIVTARAIALRYGVAAHWMRRARLLTSMMRVPERLAAWPELHRLYTRLWGLGSEPGAVEFTAAYEALPDHVCVASRADYEMEFQPALEHGLFDGAVHYMRWTLPDDFDMAEIAPVLGLWDDLAAQRDASIKMARELLQLVAL